MKALVIADRPPSKPIPQILSEHPDIALIVTLGDLSYFDLQPLAEITGIPKIGVYGNHCDGRYMEALGIANLHLARTQIGGISFMGYQWCVKYKESPLQSTQEQCLQSMRSAAPVDVFISHCPARGINDNDDPAHVGFEWLREYLDRASPRYFLHGHTYDDGRFVEKYRKTEIVYVHGAAVADLA